MNAPSHRHRPSRRLVIRALSTAACLLLGGFASLPLTSPALAAPATDPESGSISGTVSLPAVAAGTAGGQIVVTLYRANETQLHYMQSLPTTDGRYRFTALPAGTYGLRFSCSTSCAAPYLTEWWDDGRDEFAADRFELGEGQALESMDASVSVGSSIGGTVRGFGGSALGQVTVELHRLTSTGYTRAASTTTDASGAYRFTRLWDDEYSLRFAPTADSGHLAQWWGGAPATTQSTSFDLAKDGVLEGMDVTLTAGASVTGTVLDGNGVPVDSYVGLFSTARPWEKAAGVWPDSSGRFVFENVLAGTYTIGFNGQVRTGHLGEWWNDRPGQIVADTFVIGEGEHLSGFDAELATEAVQLTGPALPLEVAVGQKLSASASSSTPGAALEFQWFADSVPIAGATGPQLLIDSEALGRRLQVRVVATASGFSPVQVTSERTFEVAPAPPPPAPWGDVIRLAGADRYATSVAVSQAQFAPGVDTVFIASGTDFPDALSGAPIAGLRNGPLLLTPSWGLPQVVIDEIRRLRPKTAIIFGGPAVVSGNVQAQLEELTGSHPSRFSGADRYSTSVAIARMEYAATSPSVVYIANGGTFPDALSGAPLAGLERGALLLSQRDALPSVIAAELERMRPGRIVILGGTASIGAAVEAQLAAYASGGVTRLAGADRYATSVAISQANFAPGVPVAYIANGWNFPDALSGAPVAAIQGGPVLLTPSDGLPDSVIAELRRLRPERIVVLGGTATISPGVAAALEGLS